LTELEKKTLFSDSMRQAVDGTIETLKVSIFLLVAINLFDAQDWQSSLISQSFFIGMLLSLFFTPLLENHFSRSGRVLFILSLPSGLALILTAWAQNPVFYSVSIMFSGLFLSLRVPFFTGLYSENYQAHRRARLMSVGALLFLFATTLTNFIFGKILDISLDYYRYIFPVCGFLVIINGISLLFVPGSLPEKSTRQPFWMSLNLLWKNWKFGLILSSWFLLGFSNLWSLPLRTVYLADPERGLGWTPSTVLLVLGVIPGCVKIIFNFIWAHLYDKLPFVWTRILINVFLVTGIFVFFRTESIFWITTGSILMNIALAGSPFIWNLWVTRIAPQDEVRKYMSVHTFMAGLRGVIAPVVGFGFIMSHSIQQVGSISFLMGLLGSLLLIPLTSRKHLF